MIITWNEIKNYFINNRIEIIITVILIPILLYMIIRILKKAVKFFFDNDEKPSPAIVNVQLPLQQAGGLDKNIISSQRYSKADVSILFIDDDTSFKVVKILKQSGWTKTKLIKDVKSLSGDEIRSANIIFTDIRGVGKLLGFQDEGLGLASAIKEKYPEKKVVIYSSEESGNRFHKGFRLADDMLAKNAEPYEFISTIEQLAEKLSADGKI